MKLSFLFLTLFGVILAHLIFLKYSECATELIRDDVVRSRLAIYQPGSRKLMHVFNFLSFFKNYFLDSYPFILLVCTFLFIGRFVMSGQLGLLFHFDNMVNFFWQIIEYSMVCNMVSFFFRSLFKMIHHAIFFFLRRRKSSPQLDMALQVVAQQCLSREEKWHTINRFVLIDNTRYFYIKWSDVDVSTLKEDIVSILSNKDGFGEDITRQYSELGFQTFFASLKSVSKEIPNRCRGCAEESFKHISIFTNTMMPKLRSLIYFFYMKGKDSLIIGDENDVDQYNIAFSVYKNFFSFFRSCYDYINVNIAEVEDLMKECNDPALRLLIYEHLAAPYSDLYKIRTLIFALMAAFHQNYEKQKEMVRNKNLESKDVLSDTSIVKIWESTWFLSEIGCEKNDLFESIIKKLKYVESDHLTFIIRIINPSFDIDIDLKTEGYIHFLAWLLSQACVHLDKNLAFISPLPDPIYMLKNARISKTSAPSPEEIFNYIRSKWLGWQYEIFKEAHDSLIIKMQEEKGSSSSLGVNYLSSFNQVVNFLITDYFPMLKEMVTFIIITNSFDSFDSKKNVLTEKKLQQVLHAIDNSKSKFKGLEFRK